jgi:hypothetical protein
VGSYERVSARLYGAGYPDPEPPMRRITALFADPWSEWEGFCQLVAGLSEPDPLTLVEAWALPHLCTVVDTLDFNDAGIGDVTDAFTRDDPALLAAVVRVQAAAAGIPLGKLAAEGRRAKEIHRESPKRVPNLLLTPAPSPIVVREPQLSSADIEQLLRCLGALSALTANFAFERLAATKDRRLGRRMQGMLPGLRPQRRRNAALLACLLAEDPAATAEELLDGDEPRARAGAAAYLAWAAPRTERGLDALRRARADLDLTVRLEARDRDAADTEAAIEAVNDLSARPPLTGRARTARVQTPWNCLTAPCARRAHARATLTHSAGTGAVTKAHARFRGGLLRLSLRDQVEVLMLRVVGRLEVAQVAASPASIPTRSRPGAPGVRRLAKRLDINGSNATELD